MPFRSTVTVNEMPGGVYRLRSFGNAYLIRRPRSNVLIDTGTPRLSLEMLRAIRRIIGNDHISTVALTHCHADHSGGISRLLSETRAKIYVGTADLEHVRTGKTCLPRGLCRVLARMTGLHQAPGIGMRGGLIGARELRLEAGLVAIPTPGHTPGHTAYHFAEQSTIFTGDAAERRRNVIGLASGICAVDIGQAHGSLERLRRVAAACYAFGHGDPFVVADAR